ncbi:DsrE family protein [Janibacter sp. GS2]|uniref:DsrE family protein n=1 Tax=Janibacter sp. GS2 TaxID=3442646 RepID=UPI003EB92D54
MTASRLVVKITHGPQEESLERLAQGLTVAATAAASDLEVSLWLTGDATLVATAGADLPSLEHSAPLADLVATVLQVGTVTVCTQCARRRGLRASDLVEGARIAGAASFVEETMAEGTRALVY